MSVRTLNQKLCTGKKQVDVEGSFAPAGTGAVTAVKGSGFTVVRTDVGLFTVTLDQSYYSLVSATATPQLAAAADMAIQCGAYDAAAKTLVIRSVVADTETDIAANANNRINFRLTFSETRAPN